MVKTAVILAAGKLKDFATPACLLPISSETIITSMFNTLEKLNFTKIIVVTGFQSEKITSIYQNKNNIIWVHNTDYMYCGTMHSLSLVSQYIKEDFLLLDGDLIIPSYMIQAIAKSPAPIVTATSNLTGSGDEAFVEINKASYLIGLSKDIRQLNTIHTEMIGITKISYLLFNDMLKSYSLTENLWINYEYIMLQLRNDYPIYCLHFDNTPWIDIDNYEAYCKAQNNIITAVKIFDENIHIVRERFASVIAEPINHISLAGGMTNDNFKVTTFKNTYFVRLPGSGTSSIIDREHEPYNIKIIQNLDIDAPIILIDSSNGFKITEYIVNSVTFSKRTARLPQHLKKVANLLRTLHQSNAQFMNKFDFVEILEQYTKSLQGPVSYKNYQQILSNIKSIHNWLLSNFEYCEAPCHNDLVPENFLLDEKGKLFLIDWEYSGVNDYYWDLASYLLECEANKEETIIFLFNYFNSFPSERDLIKIKIYQAFQDILWAIWALVKKEKNVDDFVIYGMQRYERGSEAIEELIKYV
ncbi:phosphotransferase [Lysinibacillus sphaericus]|uniref:phosphotransferase n=1 Tax=Lysinibacillus sphaericus TaxID=1421 RepID=UPI00117DC878|nr:phosphotransferase [Lysinibacillus sphaericus]QIC48479.1 phosphotransferase [Lysinibacillus sphaericus]QTB27693.1 phosphotransferase [Lysinibacillus sphaericus]